MVPTAAVYVKNAKIILYILSCIPINTNLDGTCIDLGKQLNEKSFGRQKLGKPVLLSERLYGVNVDLVDFF